MSSDLPRKAARSVLQGYRYQDLRMEHVLRGEYAAAERVAQKAIDAMAQAYTFEFKRASEAAEAGRHFMLASFMQDEIENWARLHSAAVPERYLSVPQTSPVHEPKADPRWQCVATELEETCELAGIDTSYVEPKIRFLKLHGSGDSNYRQFARRAERIRIMAMGDISESVAEELTQYFLRGVKEHDKWNEYDSLNETAVEIVSEFYRRVQSERS